MSDKQWPQHNDYRRPPVGEREPEARYQALYWSPLAWGGTSQVNSWWDGGEFDTPESAREYIERHRPGKPYVLIKLVTTVEIVDASAMHYEPDDPHYGIELRALDECPFTQSHTRHWCGYKTCRES